MNNALGYLSGRIQKLELEKALLLEENVQLMNKLKEKESGEDGGESVGSSAD